MFHFPALPPPALCVQAGVTGNYARQVSLFGNPRITVWLPTSRGLSQAPTSFFGSWCQGIHRAPLSTWRLLIDARVHYAVLKIRAVPRQNPAASAARRHGPRGCLTARSLRTQQRARPAPRRRRRSAPEGVLDRHCRVTSRITRRPQMSSHPRSSARDMALDAAPAGPAPGAP
jgi:hypothetical protein